MINGEPLNDLRPDEVNAGPASGMEHGLLRAINRLHELLETKPEDPKIKTALEHNQTLLDETGPKRNFENRIDRRRRKLRAKGFR